MSHKGIKNYICIFGIYKNVILNGIYVQCTYRKEFKQGLYLFFEVIKDVNTKYVCSIYVEINKT